MHAAAPQRAAEAVSVPKKQRVQIMNAVQYAVSEDQINTNYILACCGAASVTSKGKMASAALGGIILTHLQTISQH